MILGLGGNDTLDGELGNDCLDGGDGADNLRALEGADTELGGTGKDKLLGGAGADKLFGGPGGDQVTGDLGKDVHKGQDGNDKLFAKDGKKDKKIDCGAGKAKKESAKVDPRTRSRAAASRLLREPGSFEGVVEFPAEVRFSGQPIADSTRHREVEVGVKAARSAPCMHAKGEDDPFVRFRMQPRSSLEAELRPVGKQSLPLADECLPTHERPRLRPPVGRCHDRLGLEHGCPFIQIAGPEATKGLHHDFKVLPRHRRRSIPRPREPAAGSSRLDPFGRPASGDVARDQRRDAVLRDVGAADVTPLCRIEKAIRRRSPASQ